METINFLNGDVRHVDFVNGLIICEETGKSMNLPRYFKTFKEWLADVRFGAATGVYGDSK